MAISSSRVRLVSARTLVRSLWGTDHLMAFSQEPPRWQRLSSRSKVLNDGTVAAVGSSPVAAAGPWSAGFSQGMHRQRFEELLALARRHLAEARHVIRQQEELIRAMLDRGADTGQAHAVLEKLKASADAMAEHERSIEEQIREFEQNDNQRR